MTTGQIGEDRRDGYDTKSRTSNAGEMTQNRFVLVLITQVALQVALDHVVFLANGPGTYTVLANLRSGVARAQIGLEELAAITRTE